MSELTAESPPRLVLPQDHVLSSGSVIFPGVFDQHGCPLVVFPVEFQDKLVSELTKEEVVDFINYFLGMHSKNKEASLVSVVADLREASLGTVRRVVECLLLLELHRRTVHSVYMVQPKKRDVLKLFHKLLLPGKNKHSSYAAYKSVLLKEVCELWNYVDRSQLTPSLGGYLIYCHKSWVSFVKEMDGFVQEFVAVVRRLPMCISALQSISALTDQTDLDSLKHFCSNSYAHLKQIRSDLGLDDLLRRCEGVLEKFRCPESDPCYRAMVGTHLYTHTSLEMLHNYERITAAVEKVELLWQQAFSKARVQLQILTLQREAQQIKSQMDCMWQKLQCYKTDGVTDGSGSETLRQEFESSVYTPAMALVRCAEDVIHTLEEVVGERCCRELWVDELEQRKNKFRSALELQYSSIRTLCYFHQCYNTVDSWYQLAVCESFLQDLLWMSCCNGQSGQADGLAPRDWKSALESFLRRHTCPQVEELVQLAHLANITPHPLLQAAGKQLAHRCITLRKLLMSPGSATLRDLQLALQWQYEYFKGSHESVTSDLTPGRNRCTEETRDAGCSVHRDSEFVSCPWSLRPSSLSDVNKQDGVTDASVSCSAESIPPLRKPPLSLFDSGFEGAGSGHAETGKEASVGLPRMQSGRDSTGRLKVPQLQISEENVSSVSDSEELDCGAAGNNSSSASIRIIPRVTMDTLNLEIKVQRSTTLPKNPWLSLPVDDMENSYTVTIKPSSPDPQGVLKSPSLSDRCRDQPTQTDPQGSFSSPKRDNFWGFQEAELSPIQNILSSTITEGGDRANSTTEAPPTLLWDTYDLHDVRHDTCGRLSDESLGDWELEEQKELGVVEEILGRTEGILQEEENVLAQEETLDILLKVDHPDSHWPSWNHSVHLSQMSSSDLAEAGVLGLDDDLTSPLHFSYHHDVSSSGPNSETLSPGDQLLCSDRAAVLQELENLQVLEERIMEEKLKIKELRLAEKTPERRRKAPEQLEQDEKEMERSLSRQRRRKDGRMRKQPRSQKVVKCSIMEMTTALKNLEEEDEALLMNCRQQIQGSKCLRSGSCSETSLNAEESRPNSSTAKTAPDSSQSHEAPSTIDSSASAVDYLIHCTDTDEPDKPSLSDTEESSRTATATDQLVEDSNPEQLDNHDCGPAPVAVPEEPMDNYLCLSSDHLVSSSSESNGDISPSCDPSETANCEPEKIETSDTTCTMLNLSTAGDPEKFLESEHERGNSLLSVSDTENTSSERVQEASEDQCFQKDVEGSAPIEVCRERAAFDPGDPVPHPCLPKLKPPSLHNQISSVSEGNVQRDSRLDASESSVTLVLSVPSGGPKPKEHKNPPLKVTPAVGEHNKNNNNPRCVDYVYVDKSTADQSLCKTGDQTDSALRVSDSQSLISRTELNGICLDSAEDVLDYDGPSTKAVFRSPDLQQHLQICSREMSDFQTPVVLDTGSGLIKAGFADEDLPCVIIPNSIGLPKYAEVMSGSADRSVYVGHDAQHMRGVLTLHYPIKNGIISNWDQIEMIWQHVFQQLGVDSEDHPVLLTEGAMNPQVNRQHMVQLMFESFNVPLTFIALQPVLALYSAGRTTGVVFDSGDGVSHSVPVFDGYSLPHAVQRFALAGSDVTLQLKKLLLEQGVCLRTSAEMEIVKEIKERCCYVARDYEEELNRGGGACTPAHYTLPDGQVVSLTSEGFRAPEILFKPELIGCDHYGMHESIFRSVLRSDIDLRRSFLGNIVLSGGNTLLSGLPERLQAELGRLAPVCNSVRVISPPDRDFSVWKGGAVLSSLQILGSAWISRDEYDEFGPNIVHRKCF